MNLPNIAEPTTVIGLAGLAIGAIIYLSVQHNKSIRETQSAYLLSLDEKDKNYQSFVLERNHQTGEVIQKNTEILVGVGESIKSYTKSNEDLTDSVKTLVAVHLKK